MIVEHAYAKLNLTLDVVGKRDDGFHELKMIVVPLKLSDTLTFELSDSLDLKSDQEIEHNVVYQTALYIKEKFHVEKGALITLKKRIPIGSGLGGESADIAATIRGLNQLWHLQLDHQTLEEIALALGSDTLFCLYNQTAYVSGRGDKLKFLPAPPIKNIYLCISNHPISTRDAFAHFKRKKQAISFEKLLEKYIKKDYKNFFENTYNDLLETAFSLDKTLKNTYLELLKMYKSAFMTGSGSTLFLTDFTEKKLNSNEIETISQRKVLQTAIFDENNLT